MLVFVLAVLQCWHVVPQCWALSDSLASFRRSHEGCIGVAQKRTEAQHRSSSVVPRLVRASFSWCLKPSDVVLGRLSGNLLKSPWPTTKRRQQRIAFSIVLDLALTIRVLSGPVLRDTARLFQRHPPIVHYGVFGISTWPIGCDTASPFSERFPLGEHAKWRCDTPPPSKGVSQRYLRDTL